MRYLPAQTLFNFVLECMYNDVFWPYVTLFFAYVTNFTDFT